MLEMQRPTLKTTLKNLLYHSTIAISSDSRWIIIGSELGWIKIWDQFQNRYIHNLESRSINEIVLSKDNNWLAYSEDTDPIQESEDYRNQAETPKLWVINLKSNIKQFRLEEYTNFITCIKFSSSNLLISCSRDCVIRVWSVNERKLLMQIPCPYNMTDLAIHKLDHIIGTLDSVIFKVHIYYSKNSKKVQCWGTNINNSISISFSNHGHLILIEGWANNRQIYQLYNFQTRKIIRKFKGSQNLKKIAAFSQNNQQLVIKNQNDKVAFVDLACGREIKIYESVQPDAQIRFSADWKTMVCDDLWEKVLVYTM